MFYHLPSEIIKYRSIHNQKRFKYFKVTLLVKYTHNGVHQIFWNFKFLLLLRWNNEYCSFSKLSFVFKNKNDSDNNDDDYNHNSNKLRNGAFVFVCLNIFGARLLPHSTSLGRVTKLSWKLHILQNHEEGIIQQNINVYWLLFRKKKCLDYSQVTMNITRYSTILSEGNQHP